MDCRIETKDGKVRIEFFSTKETIPRSGPDGTERQASMSEYQYYEFLAIDRPLTSDEMAALRVP